MYKLEESIVIMWNPDLGNFFFLSVLVRLLNKWNSFMEMFRMEMITVYFPDTVEEWMEENVKEYMDKLHSLAKDVERIVKLKGQQKSLKNL